MPLVQISIVEGRDKGIKRGLVTAVTDAVVEELGVSPKQVRVLLYELPAGNWAIGGTTKDEPG